MASGLAAFLEGEMRRRGWSGAQLAERAGLHRGTVSKIFNRPQSIPDLETLDGLADALQLPLSTLIRVCGFEPGEDDGQLDVEQTAILLDAIPELRPIAEAVGAFSAADRRALLAYIEGMRHQQSRLS